MKSLLVYLLLLTSMCVCLQTDGSFNFTETNGLGKCPYDPRHNSTFVYVGKLFLAAWHQTDQGVIK